MQPMRTNPLRSYFHMACLAAALILGAWAPIAQADGVLGPSPETTAPLVTQSSPPLLLLTMARDHTLFFGAYNDLTALSGDDAGKVGFQPTINYLGLFNSNYCYGYTDGPADANGVLLPTDSTTTAVFSPVANAVSAGSPVYGQCVSSGQSTNWSGNFLNYLTTARIDALRVALYGGTREVDTNTETILRRTYIPRDAHAWAIQYNGTATDGYDIALFTPLGQPASNTRHLLGNLTDPIRDGVLGHTCEDLDYCSSFPPLIRVVTNSQWTFFQWIFVNKFVMWTKRPREVDGDQPSVGSYKDYAVRVKVCTASYNEGCKAYSSNGSTYYKPIGVLHTYGESGQMKIGLLTGSYDKNKSGGRIRKNISAFTDEVDSANGRFLYPNYSIVQQLDKLRIIGYNNIGLTDSFFDYYYPLNGEGSSASDWGSPLGEMMYEGLRYFAGATRTDDFNHWDPTQDAKVGLQAPDWTDPYSNTGSNVCAKPSQLVISGITNQYDSDQLPGSFFNSGFAGTLTNTLNNSLNVTNLADDIGRVELINSTSRVIGEAPFSFPGTNVEKNGTPTAKSITSLGKIRGLPIDETMREGSYYAASVAYFGKKGGVRAINGTPIPTVDTYALALNSPFPKIVVPFPSGKEVTIYPFAKYSFLVDPPRFATLVDRAADAEQNGVIINTLTDSANAAGNYHLNMTVRYGQTFTPEGYGLYSLVTYDIRATASNLTINTKIDYTQFTNVLNIGYSITGTTNDGPYLVIRSKNTNFGDQYYLNVPAGEVPGYCNQERLSCKQLPYRLNWSGYGENPDRSGVTFSFTPSITQVQPVLKPPLWYAAKWGGFADGSPPTGPTVTDPDNYILLKNPAQLKAAFAKMFQLILDQSQIRGGRSGAAKQLNTQAQIFTTTFNLANFSGDLKATTVSQGTVGAFGTLTYGVPWTANFPAEANRNIYYRSPTGNFSNFTIANLNSDYPENFSADLVGYLRGDRSNEVSSGGTFRNRDVLLGTTINSAPFYSQDTGMVYLGANDGMLHAFDAVSGLEKFAFVPSSAISTTALTDDGVNRSILAKLSTTNYSGRYYMDGNIAVSNLAKAETEMNGANYLVGFLGRGGKGLFGLPVDLNGIKNDLAPWERFGANDGDMGYLLGAPVIEQLSDGTNVVLFGNGYNSTNNTAVLYVVRLRDGVILGKYATNTGSSDLPNGLATPGVTRQSGYLQYAYAGDYLGNVWKFDLRALSSQAANNLPTASFTGNGISSKILKVFIAKAANGAVQPIVAPMVTAFSGNNADTNVQSKRYVFFGTGSDLTNGDLASGAQQTMYGLIDPGTFGTPTVIGARDGLVQRTLEATTGVFTAGASLPVRSFSLPVAGDMAGKSGWYMDWSKPNDGPSEKVYSAANLRRAATPTLVVSSNIVTNTSCSNSTSAGFLNAMDAYFGGGLVESFFDINRNGSTQDEKFSVGNSDKVISSIDLKAGSIGQGIFFGDNVVVQGQGAAVTALHQNLVGTGTKKSSQVSRRISWREIVR